MGDGEREREQIVTLDFFGKGKGEAEAGLLKGNRRSGTVGAALNINVLSTPQTLFPSFPPLEYQLYPGPPPVCACVRLGAAEGDPEI